MKNDPLATLKRRSRRKDIRVFRTFDDAYKALYPALEQYCINTMRGNTFLGQEVASKSFDVLYIRWDEIEQRERHGLWIWLLHTANNKKKEILRKQPKTLSLDDPNTLLAIEHDQLKAGRSPNEELEYLTYQAYVSQIEKRLKKNDRKIFRKIAIEHSTYKELSEETDKSINSLYLKWMRVRNKVKKIILELEK